MSTAGFIAVGGFEAAMIKFMSAVPNTTILHAMTAGVDNRSRLSCGVPPDNSLHLFRSADDDSLPWPGIVFGLSILSVWYWCTDQVCSLFMLMRFVMDHFVAVCSSRSARVCVFRQSLGNFWTTSDLDICPACGRGTLSPPFSLFLLCPFTSSSFGLFYFSLFFSFSLPIFFFSASLPFLPE